MSKLIEEIKKVIDKIEKDIKKEDLKQSEVEQILNDVDDGLVEIEESAEKNQKEIVSKKVDELRGKVDEGLTRKWRWGRVQGALKNIKQDLEELKNSLSNESTGGTYGFGESMISLNDEDKKELIKWRKVFPGKSPEEVNEYLKKLAEEWIENKRRFEILEKRTGEVAKMTSSAEVVELSKEVNRMGIEYVEAGGKAGGPVLGILGNLIGAGLATYQGTTIAGAKIYEDTLRVGVGFTEHIADNTKDLIEKGMGSATEVTKSFFGALGNRRKVLAEKVKASESSIENLEQQLEKKDEEFKQRLEEMSERIEKQDKVIEKKEEEIRDLREQKNEEIRRLQDKNDKLQEQLNSLQNKLIAQVEQKPVSSPYGEQ